MNMSNGFLVVAIALALANHFTEINQTYPRRIYAATVQPMPVNGNVSASPTGSLANKLRHAFSVQAGIADHRGKHPAPSPLEDA